MMSRRRCSSSSLRGSSPISLKPCAASLRQATSANCEAGSSSFQVRVTKTSSSLCLAPCSGRRLLSSLAAARPSSAEPGSWMRVMPCSDGGMSSLGTSGVTTAITLKPLNSALCCSATSRSNATQFERSEFCVASST